MRCILAGLLLLAMLPTPILAGPNRQDRDLKGKLAAEKAKAARIERELRQKRQTLKKVKSREKGVERELAALAARLKAQEARLNQINSRLGATETSFRRTEGELAVLLPRIRSLREGCRDRLHAMSDLEPENDPAAIFAGEHVSRSVIDSLLLESLAEAEAAAAHGYTRDAERLRRTQERLASERKELEVLKAEQAAEQAKIEATRREQAKLLASLGRQEKAVAQDARTLEASRRALLGLIDALETRFEAQRAARERAAREKAQREKAQAKQKAEPQAPARPGAKVARAAPETPRYEPQPGTGFAALKGRLPPPVAGRVTNNFGRRDEFGLICTGVDITARDSEPIKAVSSGTVAYAGMLKGYGKLVIIDHGEGWYSLYGRAGRLSAAPGDHVRGGQILGTLADGAEGLYFEIRHHRKPQNPVGWLAGPGN
jgi:septal ring factor EnvC (AmiA/AmiB activator)